MRRPKHLTMSPISRNIRRTITSAIPVALAVLGVGACGSSTTTTKTVTVSSASASGTQTTSATTAASQSTTGGSTSNNTAQGTPLCRAGTLALGFLGQQGATGHGVLGFTLRNTGSASCHTFGFPGILWLSKTGAPLPTKSIRTTRDFFGAAPLVSLTVMPGSVVSFRLGVTHIVGGGTKG